MRKTLVIAIRDYLAAVKTKSFIVGLVLMPVLIGGGVLFGHIANDIKDTKPKKIVVIDHTVPIGDDGRPTTREGQPLQSQPLYQVLISRAQERNEGLRNEKGELTGAPYEIEAEFPDDGSPAALDQLRYELSERLRSGELFAFIELGPNIITPPDETAFAAARELVGDDLDDGMGPREGGEDAQDQKAAIQFLEQHGIRYTSQSTTYLDLQRWLRETLQPVIYQRRIAATPELAGVAPQQVLSLIVPPEVIPRAMAVKNEAGEIDYEEDPNPITSFVIPIFSIFLIFSVVMTAASPLTTNIVEEKQLRIAEVLLGSVRPFELMLGKLIGGVGVSLTLAAIYFAGGLYAASQFNALSAVSPSMVAWFMLFASLATLMYGALFIAAGAAVTNLKEAQNFLTPIILLVVAPMMVMVPVIQSPDGPIARAITWFPLTSPVAVVLRQSIPPGMPLGEKMGAAALSIVTTLVLVWLAGRIFRFGMLHTDKAAAIRDMMRWVVRG